MVTILHRPAWLLAGFVALAVGCNAPERPVALVTGTVTVESRPLSGAVVTLEPLRGTTGPNASTAVFDGRFEFGEQAALHGGAYRVRISMLPREMRSQIQANGQVPLPPNDAEIDQQYDAQSELSCTLHTDQENVLSFEVEFL